MGQLVQYEAAPPQIKTLRKNDEKKFKFENSKSPMLKYSFSIEKQDKDDAELKLAGTTFKLLALEDVKFGEQVLIKAGEYVKGYNDGDNSSWTWDQYSTTSMTIVTDDEGNASVNELPQGEYQLVEIASSVLNNTEYSTKIEVSSATAGMRYSYEGNKLNFTNSQNNEVVLLNQSIPRSDKGSIKLQLYKCDSENNEKQISDVKFVVCKTDESVVTMGQTDGNGYLSFPSYNIRYEFDSQNQPINFEEADTNLFFKDTVYYLQETETGPEYVLDDTKHYFKITCDWNPTTRIYDIAVKSTDASGNVLEKNEWVTNSSSSINAVYTFTATNKHKKAYVTKVDQYGNPVIGAYMQMFRLTKTEDEDSQTETASGDATVEDEQTDIMDGYEFAVKNEGDYDMTEWVTDGREKEIDVQTGTYLLRETAAPSGYYPITEKLVEVKKEEEHITIEAVDDVVHTYINKYEKGSLAVDDNLNESYTPVPGATLQLYKVTYNKDGSLLGQELVDQWKTDGTTHILNGLPQGDYLLHELAAPDGYAPAEDIYFTLNYGEGDQTINMYDVPMTLSVNKFMVDTTQWCVGCTLAIYDSKGNEIEKWVTEEDCHSIKALKVGNYVLKELSAPEGYRLAKDIPFTISYEDYENGNMEKVVNMYNTTTYKVTVNKYRYASTEAIKGAKMALYKVVEGADDRLLDSWTSNGKSHVVSNLEQGTYYVRELEAPDGYKVADDIKFTIDGSSSNTTVNMYDRKKVNLYVHKYEAGTKKYVPGARLAVYDSKGKEVANWTTTNKAYVLKDMPNGKYVLKELSAPEGYLKAKVISFTISDKTDNGRHTVTMYDRTKQCDLKVYKLDKDTKEAVKGATLALYDSCGEQIEKWVSTSSPKNIKNIENGEYVLKELSAPEGYQKAKDISFTIDNEEQSGTYVVTMYDEQIHRVPKTGDDMHPVLCILLGLGMGIGAAAGVTVMWRRRREKHNITK